MLDLMAKLATAHPEEAASNAVRAPRPCASVEGIEFWIQSSGNAILRCVITDPVLQNHYGAEGRNAASWMVAFMRHRTDIERRALDGAGGRDDVHVVLINDATGRLKAAAGRCGR